MLSYCGNGFVLRADLERLELVEHGAAVCVEAVDLLLEYSRVSLTALLQQVVADTLNVVESRLVLLHFLLHRLFHIVTCCTLTLAITPSRSNKPMYA
jgi:hypothetical protein